ncbi:hypothetical protein [Bacillus cereus]|uniref:hypothetical protein n=1 Tax=Bacillus cereus TaxID=1396 RepID=UPI00099597BA|nr:hypothetical protein [Bacillus cereus]
MEYNELDTNIKKSFKLSIRNMVNEILEENEYREVEENVSIVSDTFVVEVVRGMMDKRSFQKWGKVNFTIEDNEMKVLVGEIETNMRKKKPSQKQLEYYTSLLDQLELGENVTSDYFFFQNNMKRMKEMLEGKTPATEKQKATIQKLWKKKFGEELEMNENITKKEVTTLFEIVNNI